MMLSKSKIPGNKGFTLLEIIASLVVAGILSIFYFHFMGTAMDFSWKSVELVAGEAKAEGLMERIISDYVGLINKPPQAPPNDALTLIKNAESTYENDADYGSPVTMEYITYDTAGNEATVTSPATSSNLKVTVEAPGNDFITILTRSRDDNDDPKVAY